MAQNTAFTAYVYEDDYEEMQKLVQQYPNIETGGDLFGLWQDANKVVVQLFIGPGEGCKRTTTSFHQDVNYLHKVGTVITKEEGLCNIGEWHSHHQIGMPTPSGADRRTVLSNMPQLGLDRFVLFIASIRSRAGESKKRAYDIKLEQIQIRCFVFIKGLLYDRQPIEGKIVKIEGKNPIRLENKARRVIAEGAERPPSRDEGKLRKNNDEKKSGSGKGKPDNIKGQRNDENRSPNSVSEERFSWQGAGASAGESQRSQSARQHPDSTSSKPATLVPQRNSRSNPYSTTKTEPSHKQQYSAKPSRAEVTPSPRPANWFPNEQQAFTSRISPSPSKAKLGSALVNVGKMNGDGFF